MSQVFSVLVTDPDTGDQNITVFVSGAEKPYTAHSSHPNFDAIKKGVDEGDESVVELFDVAETVSTYFDQLTDRVAVANGRVYFDGDEVNTVLTKQIIRFLDAGVQDWSALVNFFEKVATNPNEHSREQLYEWLDRRDFTICDDGDFIAYKGVRPSSSDAVAYESVHAGVGIVDGVKQNGHLPNDIGSCVEIPRSAVEFNPAVGCSTGLHVGDYDYAQGWAQGALLTVKVNPRDVVSVPTDCNAAKVRVCRYFVQDVAPSEAYASPVFSSDAVPAATFDGNEWGDSEYDPDDLW